MLSLAPDTAKSIAHLKFNFELAISDRYEIGCGQKMVIGVIFGMKFLILAMKKETLENMFLGYMQGRFGALMGPPMVRGG